MYSKLACAIPLILAALVVVAQGKHSQCYNWYHKVNRPQGITPTLSHVKLLHKENLLSSKSQLVRRITPTHQAKFVAGGQTSACGKGYDTTSDLGVCLWPGTGSSDTNSYPGWLNGANQENCNKKVWVMDAGGKKYDALVLDACSFGVNDVDTGCAGIYVTRKLFQKLGGDPTTQTNVTVQNWDFYAPGAN